MVTNTLPVLSLSFSTLSESSPALLPAWAELFRLWYCRPPRGAPPPRLSPCTPAAARGGTLRPPLDTKSTKKGGGD